MGKIGPSWRGKWERKDEKALNAFFFLKRMKIFFNWEMRAQKRQTRRGNFRKDLSFVSFHSRRSWFLQEKVCKNLPLLGNFFLLHC